jgi:SOS response regulatory protein OraA/RecX
MMRKSRFGSKAGRDASRDAEQDVKEDPDGSNSISDDAENVDAEEGVDRYERSSDRYRAAAGERAGAGGSASARRSFGNSFSKSGGASDEKTSGGFSSGKGSGSSFSSGKGGGSGSSFARKSSFGRSSGGSSLSSGTSKAEAIAASVAAVDQSTQPDDEAVYERSSDRAFPKKRGSFGGGGLGRASSKKASGEVSDTYERSSDRKLGRSGSAGSKAALAGRGATPAADGEDVFERSTDRNASRRNLKKHVGEKGVESAPRQADEERVEKAQESIVAENLSLTNPDERLKRARALLEETLAQSQAASAKAVVKRPSTSASPSQESIEAANALDIADPFEPFEQCVPSAADAAHESQISDSVYSRGSNGRSKPSATGDSRRKGPQLSLRGRALGYLSRREHSRTELSRKLIPHLAEGDSVEPLLDALEREGWLSNERFVESVVHRRGARLGTSRIVHELKRNGIDETLIQDAGATLKETELTRAREVWSKKYGELPTTPAERAKQARFLATRGFTGGVIMKVLKAGDDDFIDE